MRTKCKPYFLAFLGASLLGVPLHFLYSSTKFFPLAFISPMNESVWEHAKLAVIPLLTVYYILYRITKPETIRFISASCLGLLTSVVTIISLHYTLFCGLGAESFVWDILLYFSAMAFSLYLSCRAMEFPFQKFESILLLIASILLLVITVIFTAVPPDLPLFIPGGQ